MAYDPPGAINDVVQCTLRAVQFGQNYQTSFYYQITAVTVPGAGMYSDLHAEFQADVWSELRSFMSDSVEQARVRIQKVFPNPRYLFRNFDLTPSLGLDDGIPLPPSTAAVIRAYGAVARRDNRGRNFIFGLTSQNNTEGQIPQAAWTNWRNLAELIYEDDLVGTSYTWRPVIFAPSRPGPPPVGAHVEPIVASDINTVLRQQRRREIGVGE